MTKKFSDFKIISITLISVLIFFTTSYFKFLPLTIFKINIKDLSSAFNAYYFILTELIALLLSTIFITTYSKKNDKELKERYKSIGIGLGVIILYFILPYFEVIPFAILKVDPNNMPQNLKITYVILYSILTLCLIMLIYHKKIEKDFKDYKKNIVNYFKKYTKYWFIAIIVMVVSNLMIHLLVTSSIATNEQLIREILKISPLYIFISSVVVAPMVEELTFRQSIKNIFSNKYVFIIFSGLLFGGIHAFNNYQELTDLLYIIPYSAPGFAFAYMLEKSKNIFVPLSFHFIHNFILIILQIALLLG